MPYAQGSVKELNRKTVFELVAERGEITRIEIADETKSSVPTILKIMNFLEGERIVSLAGSEKTARGRYPQVFRFEPDSILGIGISFDGHHMTASLVNYYGEEKRCIQEDVTESFDYMMENYFPAIVQALTERMTRTYIRGIGICIGGTVDTDHSQIQLGGFSELVIRRDVAESVQMLSRQTGLPVYLFNDVNAAAVGEYVLRKMKKEDLVYIYVSEETGAGIILDGKLRTGKNFYSGEVAHMVFDADFETAWNRPGWMERKLSRKAIEEAAPEREGQIDYAARYISLVIANLCNTMDIQNVVLGGETVKKLDPELFERTKTYLNHLTLFPVNLTRSVNERSALAGAAYLTVERQLSNILSDNGRENGT